MFTITARRYIFFEATFSPIIRKGYLTRSGKRSTLFHQWLYTLVKLGVQLVDGASLERVAPGTLHRNRHKKKNGNFLVKTALTTLSVFPTKCLFLCVRFCEGSLEQLFQYTETVTLSPSQLS